MQHKPHYCRNLEWAGETQEALDMSPTMAQLRRVWAVLAAEGLVKPGSPQWEHAVAHLAYRAAAGRDVTCPHCRQQVPCWLSDTRSAEGLVVVATHNWPRLTRQVCPGAGQYIPFPAAAKEETHGR